MPTNWKALKDNKYLGAYAFQPGQEMFAVIDAVDREAVMGSNGQQRDCIVIHFQGDTKPLIANSTNCKTIEKLYGPYIEDWEGKGILLTVQRVQAFGEEMEAVRIRPIKPPTCDECGAFVPPSTREKNGRRLCASCAAKR